MSFARSALRLVQELRGIRQQSVAFQARAGDEPLRRVVDYCIFLGSAVTAAEAAWQDIADRSPTNAQIGRILEQLLDKDVPANVGTSLAAVRTAAVAVIQAYRNDVKGIHNEVERSETAGVWSENVITKAQRSSMDTAAAALQAAIEALVTSNR